MFRSRRNGLLKRLWRLAASRSGVLDATEEAEEDTHPAVEEHQVGTGWIKSAARTLFKRLTDDQLASLLDVVEGAGATSSCLLLDSELINRNLSSLPTNSFLSSLFTFFIVM